MAFLRSIVLYGFLISFQNINFSQGFCYTRDDCNPSRWGGQCQTGERQSPIDIPISFANLKNAAHTNLVLSSCYSDPQPFNLQNNGHTVEAELEDDQTSCTVTGGFLNNNTYKFAQIHFHWGSGDLHGSEHTINNKTYVLEGHMVHYRSDFDNSSHAVASGQRDALTVLSILFTVSPFDNRALAPFIPALKKIRTAGTETEGFNLVLADFLDINTEPIFPVTQYYGSLTTPDCYEVVLWNVFPELQTVSEAQLYQLRLDRDDEGDALVDNDRPVQPLNGRVIRPYLTSIETESDPTVEIVVDVQLPSLVRGLVLG